jgi:hypothetical protein
MGSKPTAKTVYITAIRYDFQQGFLECSDCSGRLKNQIKGGVAASVSKKIETGQLNLKRLKRTADLIQKRRYLFKGHDRPEGIEQSDMRHPAPIVPVTLFAHSLDRLPEVIGRYGHNRCFVRLGGAAGRETSHTGKSGFTTARGSQPVSFHFGFFSAPALQSLAALEVTIFAWLFYQQLTFT